MRTLALAVVCGCVHVFLWGRGVGILTVSNLCEVAAVSQVLTVCVCVSAPGMSSDVAKYCMLGDLRWALPMLPSLRALLCQYCLGHNVILLYVCVRSGCRGGWGALASVIALAVALAVVCLWCVFVMSGCRGPAVN